MTTNSLSEQMIKREKSRQARNLSLTLNGFVSVGAGDGTIYTNCQCGPELEALKERVTELERVMGDMATMMAELDQKIEDVARAATEGQYIIDAGSSTTTFAARLKAMMKAIAPSA